MAVTTWVLIILVISLAILLTVVMKEFQPKAARKAHVDQAIHQDTSMEHSEDLTPNKLPEVVKLPQVPETPWDYGENEIKLLFQDPYNIYAYWEITEKTNFDLKKRLDNDFHQSTLMLKLYQISNNDIRNISLIQNQPVADEQRSWYFHVGEPEATFYVELGRYLSNGSFILITRSNLIETPPDKVSDIIDDEWALLDKYQKLLYQGQMTTKHGSSSEGVSSFSFYQEELQ